MTAMAFNVTYQPKSGKTVREELDATVVTVGEGWITFWRDGGAGQLAVVAMVRSDDIKRVDQG
jgi:DsbC/DsbD-like thiol-disulfide interchange protein